MYDGQALKFPRNNYEVDGVELSCDLIPQNIKYAQFELARALANDALMLFLVLLVKMVIFLK